MYEDLSFRFYSSEELIIDSIDSRLEDSEKAVRRFIMNNIINEREPYNLDSKLEEASLECELQMDRTRRIYESLVAKQVIVPDEDENVNFVYPVSALETNHRVSLKDGRSFTAMCAIDSIGSHFTFKQDVEINSICSNRGEKIHISLKDGEILDYSPRDLHILHVDLNKNDDWSGDC